MKNKHLWVSSGFSLVELMITLIVVSCLAAAMAPVITKKLKNSGVAIGKAQENIDITNECSENFSQDCKLCQKKKKCLMCEKTCPENEIKNNEKCTCIKCSELNEGCVECDANNCTKCSVGYGLNLATKKCEPCPQNCISCTTNDKCVLCKSGYYIKNNKCNICDAGYYCEPGQSDKTICPAGTYSNQGAIECSNCPEKEGSNPGSTECFNCGENCKTCSSQTQCTYCENGYKLNNGICEKIENFGCEEHCLTCSQSNTCDECDASVSYRNDLGGCSPRCKISTSPYSCDKMCQDAGSTWSGNYRFLIYNKETIYLTQSQCSANSPEFVACKCNNGESKFYQSELTWDSTSKNKCPSNCINCDSTGTQCLQCADKYKLQKATKTCSEYECSQEKHAIEYDEYNCPAKCAAGTYLYCSPSAITGYKFKNCHYYCTFAGGTVETNPCQTAKYVLNNMKKYYDECAQICASHGMTGEAYPSTENPPLTKEECKKGCEGFKCICYSENSKNGQQYEYKYYPDVEWYEF